MIGNPRNVRNPNSDQYKIQTPLLYTGVSCQEQNIYNEGYMDFGC